MKVVGLQELKADLLKVSQFVHDQVMPDAVMAAAEVIRNEIQRRAPRRTGNLARSIKIQKAKSRSIAGAEITGARVGADLKGAPYDVFIEYGYNATGRATVTYTTVRGDRWNAAGTTYTTGRLRRTTGGAAHSQMGVKGTKVPARPFVRPSLDSAGERAVEAAGQVAEQKLKSMGIS